MKFAVFAILLSGTALLGQSFQMRELPNATAGESIFEPVSSTSSDGISSIRANGAYKWDVAPVIGMKWDGSAKNLSLAIEVIGSDLTPSMAVVALDGKTFVLQSADWKVDRRGNLVAFFDKEALVRSMAQAQKVSITVFAPAPLTSTFQYGDLGVFRSMVEAFDTNAMHLANGEATHTGISRLVTSSGKHGWMKVTVITQEPSTTAYAWQVDGRVSVTCSYDTCDGYYTRPSGGTQQVQGAVLKLLRPDLSIAIVQCISKVNVFATAMAALDSASVNDPNSPTFYRDCRVPLPNSVAEADFHKTTVKLKWRFDGAPHTDSETYEILGFLAPVSAH